MNFEYKLLTAQFFTTYDDWKSFKNWFYNNNITYGTWNYERSFNKDMTLNMSFKYKEDAFLTWIVWG